MAKYGLIGFTINTDEIKAYQIDLLRAKNEMNNFERDFLNTLANEIIKKAMARTPVDTGRLRRSYKVKSVTEVGGELQISVFNDARDNGVGESYASYIEYGHFTRNRTRWIEGVGMLTMATDEVRAEMQRVWDIKFQEWARRMNI